MKKARENSLLINCPLEKVSSTYMKVTDFPEREYNILSVCMHVYKIVHFTTSKESNGKYIKWNVLTLNSALTRYNVNIIITIDFFTP